MLAPAILLLSSLLGVQDPAACSTLEQCRTAALEAAQREDYEAFHDLAWRALQRGPRNDAALMTMVARAQSLSGRPHDALVMLQRLAGMNVVTDAATSDDFRRVRALPGWTEFEARVAALSAPKPAPPVPIEKSAAISKPPPPAKAEPAKPELPAKSEAAIRADERPAGKPDTLAEDALRFAAPAFTPAGLAYDAVSNRFIVGNRQDRKLTVIGEVSHRIANLAGQQSAGFGEIAGLEIDPKEGDLWVVSVIDGAPASSLLHKLQLISGRQLYSLTLDPGQLPARFADVVVAPSSGVVVLDAAGSRLFRAAPRSRELQLAAELKVAGAISVAAASDATAYVAHDKGIVRVDLASRAIQNVKAAKAVDLARLAWMRWHRGSLIAIQGTPDRPEFRVVRLRVDAAGRTVTGLTVLDAGLTMPDPSAAAVSGGMLYYLAAPASASAPSSETVDTIVRRLPLKW